MFGTLSPHRCTLADADHTSYRAFYCGVCHALGRSHGLASRGVLSRDAVFVAVIADAVRDEASGAGTCRCPVMPVRHHDTVDAADPPVRYAAAVGMLVADQFLADRADGGGLAPRAAHGVISRAVTRSRREIDALGPDLSALEGFEQRQQAAEGAGATPAQAARPTADALAMVFGGIADLDGTAAAARTTSGREHLARLGRALGTAIYLVDALEDLRRDALRGSFNPCLASGADDGPQPSSRRVRAACQLLRRALSEAREALDALPLQRHRPVIDNIVLDRLTTRANRARQQAHQSATASGREEIRHWRAQPWLTRAAVAAVAVLVAVWGRAQTAAAAMLARMPGGSNRGDGLAQEGDEAPQGGDGGGEPPTEGGEGSAEGAQDAAQDGSEAASGAGSPDCGEIWDSLTSAGREFFSSCSDCCSATGRSCSECRSCEDCFDPCGEACGQCCEACEGCTDGCSGCSNDCGGCCDECGACGDCCNDCDDCGNCCNDCDDCGNCCNDCDCNC